ncbi:MAG: hypothetical protein WAM30_06765 [Candidatus Dormiibacterota bacterium]
MQPSLSDDGPVAEAGSGEASGPPPWDWGELDAAEFQEAWRDLAIWVEWLRRSYGEWVTLPDCWPEHESLRSELCAFRWWHKRALHLEGDPEDLIRWHGEIRRAAESWARLATCEHAAPSTARFGTDEGARRQRFTQHLRTAMANWRPPA